MIPIVVAASLAVSVLAFVLAPLLAGVASAEATTRGGHDTHAGTSAPDARAETPPLA
jgi:hypothetical protein